MHRILNHPFRELGRLFQTAARQRDNQLFARCWWLSSCSRLKTTGVHNNAATTPEGVGKHNNYSTKSTLSGDVPEVRLSIARQTKITKLRKKLRVRNDAHPFEQRWKLAVRLHYLERGEQAFFKKYKPISRLRKNRILFRRELKAYGIEKRKSDLPREIEDRLYAARLEDEVAITDEKVRRALIERGLNANGARQEVILRLVKSLWGKPKDEKK